MDETKDNCTWVGFYQELADALLLYRYDREGLIEMLQAIYQSIGMKFPRLDGSETPADIDPYTVYRLFNKRISKANRKKIIAAIAEAFDIEAMQPGDFDGIPVLNNLNLSANWQTTFAFARRASGTRRTAMPRLSLSMNSACARPSGTAA